MILVDVLISVNRILKTSSRMPSCGPIFTGYYSTNSCVTYCMTNQYAGVTFSITSCAIVVAPLCYPTFSFLAYYNIVFCCFLFCTLWWFLDFLCTLLHIRISLSIYFPDSFNDCDLFWKTESLVLSKEFVTKFFLVEVWDLMLDDSDITLAVMV